MKKKVTKSIRIGSELYEKIGREKEKRGESVTGFLERELNELNERREEDGERRGGGGGNEELRDMMRTVVKEEIREALEEFRR